MQTWTGSCTALDPPPKQKHNTHLGALTFCSLGKKNKKTTSTKTRIQVSTQFSRADLCLKSIHFFKTTPWDVKALFFTACNTLWGIYYILGVKWLPQNAAAPAGTSPSNSVIISVLTFAEFLLSVGCFAPVLLLTMEKQLRFQEWNGEPNLAPFITGYDVQKWENTAWLSEHIAALLNWQCLKSFFSPLICNHRCPL